jgi:hypothetical protein
VTDKLKLIHIQIIFLTLFLIPITAFSVEWGTMTSGTTNNLNGVWGSSATDVFAVGASGTILHYNGTSWSAMTSGTTNILHGVWGSSGTDVFAVGDVDDESGSGTILQYNGTSWSTVPLCAQCHRFNGVWGSSATDVFVVGEAGTILHYNGSTWSAMTSGTENDLHGVWGSSGTDVFALGDAGTILNYNGSTWSAMTSGTTNNLNGVWGSSATDVFAVGNSGTILHYPFSLSISVSTSTWAVGIVDAGTVQISTSGNKITVTNNGDVSETFTLQISDEDNRDEWTHSSSETGAGNNVYVLSGIFCATSDSPTDTSFNEGDSEDVLTTTSQTATATKFAYTAGVQNGVGVAISEQRSLWLKLYMPTAVSGTYPYDQHTITVRIGCQQP